MHVKTMEGLAGADTNMKLLQTPFRVYKDARRRGDTAVMERAMEYVGDFSDKTEEYQEIADKGMEEDARQAKEKAEADREAAIQKRREELEELEKKTGENRNMHARFRLICRSCRFGINDRLWRNRIGSCYI